MTVRFIGRYSTEVIKHRLCGRLRGVDWISVGVFTSIILLVGTLAGLITWIVTDYYTLIDAPIEDEVTGETGGVEWHLAEAGRNREAELLAWVSDQGGEVVGISHYGANGHDETTTVAVVWRR